MNATDQRSAPSQPIPDTSDLVDISQFLFREAQLIDDLELDDWLDLFSPHARYTLPMGEKGTGTHLHTALICDDRARLEERVMRITSGASYSQSPPSHTLHQVGNVSVVDRDCETIVVRSTQIIVELRRGVQRTFAAECTHHLRRSGSSFVIDDKTLLLLNRDEPLGDLTFVL